MREICREPGLPSWRTVYAWRNEDKDFATRFAHAREIGFDAIAEEALRIADTPLMGEETEVNGSNIKTRRRDMVEHRKLQIETRLKLLAKWDPTRYGERLHTEIKDVSEARPPLTMLDLALRIETLLELAGRTQAEDQEDKL